MTRLGEAQCLRNCQFPVDRSHSRGHKREEDTSPKLNWALERPVLTFEFIAPAHLKFPIIKLKGETS